VKSYVIYDIDINRLLSLYQCMRVLGFNQ